MTQKSWANLFLLSVLLLPIPIQIAYGQATTAGTLSGTVADASGAVVPGATLTLSQPSTGFSRMIVSGPDGSYTFADLSAGQYVLTVKAKSFADVIYNDVTVLTGRVLNLNVRVKVGTSTQTVEVSGQGEVLETTTNTLATTITADAVQDLPLNGRDALPFAGLVAGAQSGGDTRFTTYNAEPEASINITVDGMNDNFQRYRTSSTGFFDAAPVRIGAVDEISVSTTDLTADAGAEGANALRFQIKSGSNQFHGNAFWQTQNSAFNANTFFNNAQSPVIAKAPYHISDFGGSIGGPIWKNKLFFFGNYEQEYVPGSTTGYQSVLTASAQAGNFTYTGTDNAQHTVNVLSVAASSGFPSAVNSLVAGQLGQINPTFSKLGAVQIATALPYQNELVWQYPWNYDQIYPTVRIDYQIRPTIRWHVAYDLEWRTYPGYQNYPTDPYTNSSFNSSYSTFTTGLDWTISPHLVDEFNAGLLNTQEEFNVGNSTNPFGSEGNLIIDAPGFVNGSTSLSPYIPNYYLPEPRNNPVRDFTDVLTWTHRSHTFSFGGDLRMSTDFDTGEDDPPGYYLGINTLDPAAGMFNSTNFPAMNFNETNEQDLTNAENLYATLTGRVNSIYGYNYVNSSNHQYQVLGIMKQPEAQTVGGFYMQDSWRVSPHLALNYGFRWQFSGAIHNTNDTYTNPTYTNLLGPSATLFQPGTLNGVQNPQVSLRPAPYKGDMIQPSPNVGFAWNPSFDGDGFLGRLAGGSNLVIRGGAAITHYDEGWTTFEQATEYSNPGDTQDVFLNAGSQPGDFAPGSLSLGQTPPALGAFPSAFSFPTPESNFTFGYQPFATVDPNIKSPTIENWYFGVQRKFRGNTVLEVNYVGNHSYHMWMNYDLNEVSIFENGFLSEFQGAQANLNSYVQANPGCQASGTCTFEGATGTLPAMEQAFGVGGSPFSNPTLLGLVTSGQAGALANAIASNSTYFCNMVGNGGGQFSPCAGSSPTAYPINYFQANPYATGEPILLLSDPGSESYNGLQAQVKHPAGNGLMLYSNYAYSHAFTNRYIGDYYTADEAIGNFTTLRSRALSRAPSPYDQRQTFRTYGIYNLPFRGSNLLTREVAGGWSLSPIFIWQKGRNLKLLGGTNTYNYYDNYANQPDVSDSGVVLNGVTVKQLQKDVGYYAGPNSSTPRLLMNPAVFNNGEVTAEATPGKLGQFIYLTGPQFINTDFAVTKVFPIFEHLKLNMQAEMLNLFNHPDWAVVDGYSYGTNNPAQYVNLQNYPTVPGTQTDPEGLGSGGSRDIQFRAQLVF